MAKKIKVIFLIMAILVAMTACQEKTPVKSRKSAQKGSAETTTAKEKTKEPPSQAKTAKAITILTLYFSDSQGEKLLREERSVPSTNEVAAASIEQLIAGPATADHFGVIPKETRLLGVSISDKVASVNFSEELVKGHSGGSAAEVLTVYAVVNTLTEYPTIEAVRFLVDGKPIATIAGHFDLGEPVKRSESLIASQ